MKKPKLRNPVIRILAQKRGGAHEVSKSGQRQQAKKVTRQQLSEWIEINELDTEPDIFNHAMRKIKTPPSGVFLCL